MKSAPPPQVGTGDEDVEAKSLPRDSSLAQLLDEKLVDQYLRTAKDWYRYEKSTGLWKIILDREMLRYQIRIVRRMHRQRRRENQEADRKNDPLEAFYYGQLSIRNATQTAQLLGTDPQVAFDAGGFDATPGLLAVRNGVLDLRGDTPELISPSPKLYLTKGAQAGYFPDAPSPKWEKFLHSCMVDKSGEFDSHLCNWVQKLFGYMLSGTLSEEVVVMFHGAGANGKNTMLQPIAHALGDLSDKVDPIRLAGPMAARSMNNDRQAALQGLLLGWAGELPDRGEWDPSTLKELTEDVITASRKYGAPVTFRLSATLCFAGQNLPYTRDDSAGFWRRIRVVPFLASFEGRADKVLNLKETLRQEETDGIFRWMVEGWQKWKEEGLGTCDAVREASRKYQEQSLHGTPLEFIDLYCVKEPGVACHQGDFNRAYKFWAEEMGFTPWKGTTTRMVLEEKGHPMGSRKTWSISGKWYTGPCFLGLRLDPAKIGQEEKFGRKVICFTESDVDKVPREPQETEQPSIPETEPESEPEPEPAPEPVPDFVLELLRDQQMAAWHKMEDAGYTEKEKLDKN